MTRRQHESLAEWMARVEAASERRKTREHFVYRAFDSYGLLLYIGCTVDVKSRMSQHRSGSPWFRFAETLGTIAHDSRFDARTAEAAAIDHEGSYFNCTQADIGRTQANLNAAKQSLWRRGWFEPSMSSELDPVENWDAFEEASDALEPGRSAWRAAMERERRRLKGGAFPYMTDRDRLDRYLAARADAEVARQERAA